MEVFLRNQIPIQTSILDRLGEVGGLNTLLALKVGDGAGYLEHPRIDPGPQAKRLAKGSVTWPRGWESSITILLAAGDEILSLRGDSVLCYR